jgi:hypothetical protein
MGAVLMELRRMVVRGMKEFVLQNLCVGIHEMEDVFGDVA